MCIVVLPVCQLRTKAMASPCLKELVVRIEFPRARPDFCPAFVVFCNRKEMWWTLTELLQWLTQDTEKRVPVMDAQYKMIAKKAHLIAKESPKEEANEMLTTMSRLKEQLSKVGKYFLLQHDLGQPYCLWVVSISMVTHGYIFDWSTFELPGGSWYRNFDVYLRNKMGHWHLVIPLQI